MASSTARALSTRMARPRSGFGKTESAFRKSEHSLLCTAWLAGRYYFITNIKPMTELVF